MKNFLKSLLKIVIGIIIGILLCWYFHWFCADNVVIKEVIVRDTVVNVQIVEKVVKLSAPKVNTGTTIQYVLVDSSKGIVIRDTIFLPTGTVSDSIHQIDVSRDIRFERRDSFIYINKTNTVLKKEGKFLFGAGLRLNSTSDKVETTICLAHKSKKDRIFIVNWHYPIKSVILPAREQFSLQYIVPFK